MFKTCYFISLVIFLSVPASSTVKPKGQLNYNFIPNQTELSVFTYSFLTTILPNFPSREYLIDFSYQASIDLYKENLFKDEGLCYIVVYYQQPNGDKYDYDYGHTIIILNLINNKIEIRQKFRGMADARILSIKFIDFNNDNNLDLFMIIGTDDLSWAYLYYNKNHYFDSNNLLYFLDFIPGDEFKYHNFFTKIDLVKVDKNLPMELIAINDKYKRIYKWNGEVFVLKQKTRITTKTKN